MRVTHREIGQLQSDMRAWVERKRDAEKAFFSFGYNQAAKLAVYRFHKTRDLRVAKNYLNDLFDRNDLRNGSRRAQAESSLEGYVDWWRTSRVVMSQDRLRLKTNIGDAATLGGEISRIDVDVVADGYRGILLGEDDPSWAGQLRMPIIQLAIADALSRDPGDVQVGVQAMDGTGLETKQFSNREISEAMDEVEALVLRAIRMLGRR